MSRFLAPTLDSYVRSHAEKLGVKVVIDESVIDEAIKALNVKDKHAPVA